MPNFRLTLEYDGADFQGWQVQNSPSRTVQGELERAIAQVTGQFVRVIGASRTDAGVHAEGQVASAAIGTGLDAAALQSALNGVLPRDAAVVAAVVAPDDFHARYSARGKLYHYRIWNHPVRAPLRAQRALHVARKLDEPAMAEAAQALVGQHDFRSFQAAGSGIDETVRTLTRLEICEAAPGELVLRAEGDGFLRHMVRNLVGTLLEVGGGRRTPDSIAELLAVRDRRRTGPTAPAAGLTLMRVDF